MGDEKPEFELQAALEEFYDQMSRGNRTAPLGSRAMV
jgi:hypothetical protein